MIISIASGKGGTGKTTVATNLSISIDGGVQFLDCDVEEPDAHIFLKPQIKKTRVVSIPVPEIDESKCDFCGRCAEICAYNALAVLSDKVLIFPNLCHGCGGCSLLCPRKAIREVDKRIGLVEMDSGGKLQFVQGRLDIGEMMSPPLIRAVKESIDPTRTVIIDAPPGTSCPVIEAVKGSDFCLLVTEPTPFGLNDLVLAVEVLRKLTIPFGVVINRADIGDNKIESYCKENKIPILMKIPFDREIAFLYSQGIPIVQRKKEYAEIFLTMFSLVKELSKR
ncbi:ATP-binding protein [candidate division WOR-3 bacterium]|nr:ATP-binding protein [candidate division WOR-3 bacterium]